MDSARATHRSCVKFQHHGYVNVGDSICNESMEKAKKTLVFLAVGIYEAWKTPVSYFVINHFNNSQKAELAQRYIF